MNEKRTKQTHLSWGGRGGNDLLTTGLPAFGNARYFWQVMFQNILEPYMAR